MKVQVAGHLASWEKKFNDREKIMAAILTILHRKYPNTKGFIMYTRDVKIIMDLFMGATLPALTESSPIRMSQLTRETAWCQMYNLTNYLAKETIEWELQDECAIRVWEYLQQYLDPSYDWEEKNYLPREKYSHAGWMKTFKMTTDDATARFSCKYSIPNRARKYAKRKTS